MEIVKCTSKYERGDKMATKSANYYEKRIPFSLALPKEPATLDSMTTKEFNSIMETGLLQAKADQSRPVANVIADLAQLDLK